MAALGHPIVGDAKYGGPEAFLTGGISRKLHLHARRSGSTRPSGGTIDVTAELPAHFAESLAMLGFDAAAGDFPKPPKAGPASGNRRAAAAAKTRRRERRGERRARGSQAKAKRR